MSFLSKLATRALALPETPVTPVQREVRAAKGAIISPLFHNPGQPIFPAVDGTTAITRAYVQNAYASRAITTIATDISALPFRAGPATARGSDNYDIGCKLAELLGPAPGAPNPVMSANTLWKYIILQYICTGKIALAYEFDNSRSKNIIGLWALQTQYFHPIPAESGDSYFKSFDYGVKGTRSYQSYRPDQVCYIYRPSLLDVRMPESPLQSAAYSLNILAMLSQFDAAFLRNGGVPAHMVISPPWATDMDRQEFRAQFVTKFGGPSQAGKTMFAERKVEPGDDGQTAPESVEIKQIALSQKDAQQDVTREAEIEELLVAIGVPMSMLGDSSKRTFNNGNQEAKNYWKGLVKGYIRELQDGINAQLAPRLGPQVGWFDLTEVEELQPAPLFESDSEAIQLVEKKMITINEWRDAKGLPPAEEVGLDALPPEPAPVPPQLSLVPPLQVEPDKAVATRTGWEAHTRSDGVVELRGPAAAPPPSGLRPSGGFVLHSRWITHKDDVTCQPCRDNDGKIDVPTRSGIDSNGKKWTSTEEHPNCRCTRSWYLEKIIRSATGQDTEQRGMLTSDGSSSRATNTQNFADAPSTLMPVVRQQLENNLRAQANGLRMRRETRRGRTAELRSLYNAEQHAHDMAMSLFPTLAALGFTQERVAQWTGEITNRIINGLTDDMSIFDDADGFMNLVRSDNSMDMITRAEVESALLKLYSGTTTVDDILAGWS